MGTVVKQEAVYPVYFLDYDGKYPSEFVEADEETLCRWRKAMTLFGEAQEEIREAFVNAQERRMNESEQR